MHPPAPSLPRAPADTARTSRPPIASALTSAPLARGTRASGRWHWRSLRGLLNLSIGVTSLALLLALGLGLSMTHSARQHADHAFLSKDLVADILPPPMYLIELRLVLSLLAQGQLDLPAARREVDRLEKDYETRLSFWKTVPQTSLPEGFVGEQADLARRFIGDARGALEVLAGPDAAQAQARMAGLQAVYLLHRAGVDRSVVQGNAQAAAAMQGFETVSSAVLWSSVVSLGTVLVLLIGMAAAVRRRVWGAVGGEPSEVAAIAGLVASGELMQARAIRRHRGEAARTDGASVRSILAAMGQMCLSLVAIVTRVQEGSREVSSAARRIARGNQALAQRTREQAGDLQTAASTLEQLAGSVASNAASAEQATMAAANATLVALAGSEDTVRLQGTLGEVRAAATRIHEVLEGVNGIALQTHILAMNASAAAARAGEAGRGFSVLADEVRRLAQRTADAAEEVRDLARHSTEAADRGAEQARTASGTMATLLATVEDVASAMGEVSLACREQSEGLAEVTHAMHNIDRNTQQTAQLVDETHGAARLLEGQADALVETVAQLRTEATAEGR